MQVITAESRTAAVAFYVFAHPKAVDSSRYAINSHFHYLSTCPADSENKFRTMSASVFSLALRKTRRMIRW